MIPGHFIHLYIYIFFSYLDSLEWVYNIGIGTCLKVLKQSFPAEIVYLSILVATCLIAACIRYCNMFAGRTTDPDIPIRVNAGDTPMTETRYDIIICYVTTDEGNLLYGHRTKMVDNVVTDGVVELPWGICTDPGINDMTSTDADLLPQLVQILAPFDIIPENYTVLPEKFVHEFEEDRLSEGRFRPAHIYQVHLVHVSSAKTERGYQTGFSSHQVLPRAFP